MSQEQASQTPPSSTGFTPALYADIAQLLAGGNPEAPKPGVGERSDGNGLIYSAAVNMFFGPPESGKTMAADCIVADTLFAGGNVLTIDVDHNGVIPTIARFRALGVSADTLGDPQRFRYSAPEDTAEMLTVVADTKIWSPTLAVVDSTGELLPMFGANSNDADQYTAVHRAVLTAMAKAGTAVIAIDHEAKNSDSRNYGSTGSAAKKRAIDGAMLRFTVVQQFVPGHGGKAALTIVKDRHGALRATSPSTEREPLAAVFQLIQREQALDWKFWAPKADDTVTDPTVEADAAELDSLHPEPRSVRDVQDRMKWSPRRATPALKIWREKRYPSDGNEPTL